VKLKRSRKSSAGFQDDHWNRTDETLALREVYPPEEFAGFDGFGEFPEWQPDAGVRAVTPASNDSSGKGQ
jgi:hypothetical protein